MGRPHRDPKPPKATKLRLPNAARKVAAVKAVLRRHGMDGAPAGSLHLVTGPKGRALPVRMPPKQYARLETLAARSDVTVERWLDSALAAAMANEDLHWREMEDRDQMATEVDRGVFARLSRVHLGNLPPKVVDLLIEQLVLARAQGRQEGSAMRALLLSGIAGPAGLLDAVHVAHAERERQDQRHVKRLTEIAGKARGAVQAGETATARARDVSFAAEAGTAIAKTGGG